MSSEHVRRANSSLFHTRIVNSVCLLLLFFLFVCFFFFVCLVWFGSYCILLYLLFVYLLICLFVCLFVCLIISLFLKGDVNNFDRVGSNTVTYPENM